MNASGAKIARLMRNILPSEQAPYVPRSMLELVSSAAKHPQHHRCEQQVRTDGREAATLLSQSVTICIQAWFTLEEANYRRLQQQLRTRIEPPQVMEAPPPLLGQMVGGDELPGPQPGMVVQEVEAAQLSDGEDPEGAELAEEGGSDAGEEVAGGEPMEEEPAQQAERGGVRRGSAPARWISSAVRAAWLGAGDGAPTARAPPPAGAAAARCSARARRARSCRHCRARSCRARRISDCLASPIKKGGHC